MLTSEFGLLKVPSPLVDQLVVLPKVTFAFSNTDWNAQMVTSAPAFICGGLLITNVPGMKMLQLVTWLTALTV
jgi:hypothetical protein